MYLRRCPCTCTVNPRCRNTFRFTMIATLFVLFRDPSLFAALFPYITSRSHNNGSLKQRQKPGGARRHLQQPGDGLQGEAHRQVALRAGEGGVGALQGLRHLGVRPQAEGRPGHAVAQPAPDQPPGEQELDSVVGHLLARQHQRSLQQHCHILGKQPLHCAFTCQTPSLRLNNGSIEEC